MGLKETMVSPEEAAPTSAVTPAAAPAAAAAPAVVLKYADPTALGLFGLAIACAALLPLAFGMKSALAPEALRTTAMICLLSAAAVSCSPGS